MRDSPRQPTTNAVEQICITIAVMDTFATAIRQIYMLEIQCRVYAPLLLA